MLKQLSLGLGAVALVAVVSLGLVVAPANASHNDSNDPPNDPPNDTANRGAVTLLCEWADGIPSLNELVEFDASDTTLDDLDGPLEFTGEGISCSAVMLELIKLGYGLKFSFTIEIEGSHNVVEHVLTKGE